MLKKTVATGHFSKIGMATLVGMSVLAYASPGWSTPKQASLPVSKDKCLQIAKDAFTKQKLPDPKTIGDHVEASDTGTPKIKFIIWCIGTSTESTATIMSIGSSPTSQKLIDDLTTDLTASASSSGTTASSNSTTTSSSNRTFNSPKRVLLPEITSPSSRTTFDPSKELVLQGETTPGAVVKVTLFYEKQPPNQPQATGLGAAVGSFLTTLISGRASSPPKATSQQLWTGNSAPADKDGVFKVIVPAGAIAKDIPNNALIKINSQATLTGITNPSSIGLINLTLKR